MTNTVKPAAKPAAAPAAEPAAADPVAIKIVDSVEAVTPIQGELALKDRTVIECAGGISVVL